jgi:small-conductance mechanosensitive channel
MTERQEARRYALRAIAAAFVALIGLVAAGNFGHLTRSDLRGVDSVIAIAGSALLLFAGVAAVRWAGRAVRVSMRPHTGDGRAAATSLLVRAIGYVLVVIATLSALNVHVGSLLLGGALTGIILGLASQQVLSNFFAGLVLLVVRPFAVGEQLVLRAGTLGAEYDGLVVDMSAFYVTLETDSGRVALPNASVLASAIGPGAKTNKPDEDDEPAPDTAPGEGSRPDR